MDFPVSLAEERAMNPDVLVAIERLRQEKMLTEPMADFLARIAGGRLVSLHTELRFALYAGVLLFTAGAGLLLKDNLAHLGPLAIAIGISIVVMGCGYWVVRHLPRFGWGETPAEHLAFDYILLLGVLLGAADLAYIEWQFTPLGAHWPIHLLLVSLAMAGIAVRCDSRLVFSLALSTFAAWRGVSTSLLGSDLWRFHKNPASLRANAIGCGLLFLLLGFLARRWQRKEHFEPVSSHLGWIVILLALLSGTGMESGEELLFTVVLIACGSGLSILEERRRRFSLVATGMVAAYIGACLLFHRSEPGDMVAAGWYVITALGLLALLFLIARRLKESS
jgi:hypothetical protein